MNNGHSVGLIFHPQTQKFDNLVERQEPYKNNKNSTTVFIQNGKNLGSPGGISSTALKVTTTLHKLRFYNVGARRIKEPLEKGDTNR